MKKKHIVIAIVCIVVSFGIFISLPYWTIYQFQSAIRDRDAERINSYVDHPTLRQSLKDQFNAHILKSMTTELANNPFAALGAVMASTFAEKLIDSMITPAGITALITNQSKNEKSQSQIAGVNENEQISFLSKASFEYKFPSKFIVKLASENGDNEQPLLVFTRDGLSWKLTSINLPMNMGQEILTEKKSPSLLATSSGINFASVKERFVKCRTGDLLIVQGNAENKFDYSVEKVKLRLKILDNRGKLLGESEAFAGNLLTDEELYRLSDKEILAELQKPEGSDMPNMGIRSQASIPFMIVFMNPPKDVDEFIIELIGVERTPMKKQDAERPNQASNDMRKKADSAEAGGQPVLVKDNTASLMSQYYTQIWSKVRQNWALPQSILADKNLEAVLEVRVLRNGQVTHISFEKRSGNSFFDQSAYRAIKKSDPFPPLPAWIQDSSVELGLRFHSADYR